MKPALSIALLCAFAGTAAAAPRDTTSYDTVYSYSTTAGYGTNNVNATGANAGQTRTWNVPGGYTARRLVINGTLAPVAAGSWRNEAQILVTPPGGHPAFIIHPFEGGTFAAAITLPTNVLSIPLENGYDPAGTWTLAFFEEYEDAPVFTNTAPNNNPATVADSVWNTVSFTFDDALASAPATLVRDFGTVTGPAGEEGTAIGVGEVKWYKLVVSADIPGPGESHRFLDIDTSGSTSSDIDADAGDTTVALFTASGDLFAFNDDASPDDLSSQLSFGYGVRTSSTARPFDGLYGPIPAGTYYLAVGLFPFVVGDGFVAYTSNAQDTGTINVHVNTGTGTGATPPTTDVDLGVIVGNVSSTGNTLPPSNVLWFKFVIQEEASDDTGKFLDIDVEGTNTDFDDTVIAVFRSFGGLIAVDDDSGSGFLSMLTFGDTAPIRPAVGTGLARDGFDGPLEPGTYYLAVTTWNNGPDAVNSPFIVDSGGTETGTVNVNITSNLAAGGPARCNAADVAGLGGSVGPDNQLTADDVILFLSAFFAGNTAVADIAVLGGAPGQDGQLTADDIVFFLGQFFAPCNP